MNQKIDEALFIVSIIFVGIDGLGGQMSWSVNYVIPLVLIFVTLSAIIKMMIRKKHVEKYIGIQWISVIIAVLILGLMFFNFTNVLWPSLLALVLGLVTQGFIVVIDKRRIGYF